MELNPADRLSDDDGALVDIIGSDYRLCWVNEAQCAELGYPPEELIGSPAQAIYEPDSFEVLRRTIARPPLDGIFPAAELQLVRRTGRPLRTIAAGRFRPGARGGLELRLSKIDLGPIGRRLDQLETDNRLLRAFMDNATEAHWSIEFGEPVDLTQGPEEIIRQVFENQSFWRLCNRSMARLYELPEDLDLDQQSVRLYWPHSEPNEEFVRRVIEADFYIDGAISVDRRHDGSDVVIENDVRADVDNDFLYRIWGNCRNVSQQHEAETAMRRELDRCQRVLATIPDAILIVDDEGRTVWRNKAAAAYSVDSGVLARTVVELRSQATPEGRWVAATIHTSGGTRATYVHLASVVEEDGRRLTVAVLRSATSAPAAGEA